MNLEAEAVLEYQIKLALRRFEICATGVNFRRTQAEAFVIWDRRRPDRPRQVFASLSLDDTREELVRLQTEAILQLIRELPAHACPAD